MSQGSSSSELENNFQCSSSRSDDDGNINGDDAIVVNNQEDHLLYQLVESSARIFPFRNLLPEIQDCIIDFLDPMTMMQTLLVDQQFYFRVVNNQLYKSFRLIMLLYKPTLVLQTSSDMLNVSELPTDDRLVKQVAVYLLGKYKFMKSLAMVHHSRIKLDESNEIPETQLKKIDKCLAVVMRHFKLFDISSLKKARQNMSRLTSSYGLFPKEFQIWNDILEKLEVSVDLGEVDPKLYGLIEESIVFPYGPAEMSAFGESEYPQFKRIKAKLWVDKKTDRWASNFYASIKNESIYYLLARVSLLPFGSVPDELKSNKQFMIFFIQYQQELVGQYYTKMIRRRTPAAFEKMYLIPQFFNDRDIIQAAFDSLDPTIYESIFETSCYGAVENKILDHADYVLFSRIGKRDVEFLQYICEYNRKGVQKYVYTEKDYIEMIRRLPGAFHSLRKLFNFEEYRELCRVAVSLLGENFTSVSFGEKVSAEENGELFKLACQNLKNKEVFNSAFFNNLHKDLKENVEFLKQVAPLYPTLCSNFKTAWLENQMDLILHIAPFFPVLDHLFVYDARKNFKSTAPDWSLPHLDTAENRKHPTPNFLTTNLEFAKKTLKSFPYQLQRFSKKIQDKDEICSIIVESGCDLTILPMFYTKVKNNVEWISKSIEYGTNIFLFDEKVYDNPELFKLAIKNFPKILTMSEKFLKDREMVLFTIDCCSKLRNESARYLSFENIDQSLLEDDEIVERAILETPTFVDFNHLPERFQTNTKLAKATLLKHSTIYSHFPTSLKENLEIAELAIRGNSNNFNYLPQHLKESRDFFLLAISRGYNYNASGVQFQPLETDYIRWCYDTSNTRTIRLV